MDAAVVPDVRGQRRAAPASSACLQSNFGIFSRTTDELKEKLIKIGAKVVSHGRYVAFQMAEVAIA